MGENNEAQEKALQNQRAAGKFLTIYSAAFTVACFGLLIYALSVIQF